MIIKKISISICISAYNEEKNIAKLLSSLLVQQNRYYNLKELLIYADGCTDNTIIKIKTCKNKKIKLFISKKRLGQPTHMNSSLKTAIGTVIVFLDADILPTSSDTIDNLIKPFLGETRIGICSGHSIPKKGRTFIEKAVNISVKAYDNFRVKIRNGNNAYCVEGRILAVRKDLARKIHIPKGVFVNDAYIYFVCLIKGYQFRFIRSAEICYRSPSTVEDQIKQNKRFVAREILLTPMFGKIVKKEYSVPKSLYYLSLLKEFIQHPLLSGSIFFINLYCKAITHKVALEMPDAWPVALSTKEEL